MNEGSRLTTAAQATQQLRSHRAAARFFEAVADDVDVLDRVGLLMKDMMQSIASDNVHSAETVATWRNLVSQELRDENYLSHEISEFVKLAGQALITQSVDVSLQQVLSTDLDAHFSMLHRHLHSHESLARDVLSGHD